MLDNRVKEMANALNPGGLEQLILLALVLLGESAYGVSIQREIETRTARSVSLAAIYITLDRLEKKGYVSSCLGEKTALRGGRAKRYFRIQPAGELVLRESWKTIYQMASGLESWLENA
jgi:PadR family transcriptional regulator PadR